MKKSKFNLTHLHSTTLDPGYLVPFLCMPTLPNDTFRIGLSTFIRAQPMLAPLMHEVRLFTQYWFVPNRILWDEWEDFITGGEDLSLSPPLPYVTSTAADATAGSLWDYLGFPLVEGLEVSALPFRALAEIWNTRYRDQDLQDELVIDYGSNEDTTTSRKLLSPAFSKDYFTTARPFTQRGGDVLVPVSDAVATGQNSGVEIDFSILCGWIGNPLARPGTSTTPVRVPLVRSSPNYNYNAIYAGVVNWLKARVQDGTINNLLTPTLPALPSDITRDMLDARIAFTIGTLNYSNANAGGDFQFYVWVFPKEVREVTSTTPIADTFNLDINLNVTPPAISSNGATNPNLIYQIPSVAGKTAVGDIISFCQFHNLSSAPPTVIPLVGTPNVNAADFPKAFFEGTGTLAKTQSVSGFTIRDLRRSAALQRYAERSLKYGNRYEEFIQREFGIKPRDYRIQRPEYLGGGRGLLNISEVLQTAEAADTGVGTMRGHGVASISQRPIRFRCPEHGILIGLLSIRPKSVYTQGIDREWLKRSRLDFFTPELASIGMQEVLQQELYALPDNKTDVFGYSERYQEYRYQKPLVTGEFRTTLNFWNMARMFANSPNLNAEFISMENAVDDFKRPFQVQDNSAHAFICMLKNHIRAYRPIPKRAKDILK